MRCPCDALAAAAAVIGPTVSQPAVDVMPSQLGQSEQFATGGSRKRSDVIAESSMTD